MATLFRMPKVAAGATEAVLSEWLVRENSPVSAGDPIALVETDKASVEIAAETDAVLLRTLVPNGTPVEVGSPMALLGSNSDQGTDVERLLADLGITESPAAREKPAQHAVPETTGSVADGPAGATRDTIDPARRGSGRVFISPLARKLLKEAGLTPDQVRGTGPNGRIVRRDVDKAIAQTSQATPAPAPVPTTTPTEPVAGGKFQDIPHSRLRQAIASRLVESKRTIPHFYVKRTAQVDELLALREQLNAVSPHKISLNDLILRAVAHAHSEVPEANVVWTDHALRQFESVDIAVAIAGKRGLMTPVLRGVEKMSLSAIATQVQAFVRLADEGRLRPDDLEGGSITVSNLGMYGVEEFSAIINPPHSAILAVGAAVPAPAVVDGAIKVRTQLNLVLSVDHRAIDGALAARWISALVQAIEQPLRLVT